MVWHCIEERTADPIGQIVRKLIFTEIYENEHYARGKIAIPKEIQLEVKQPVKCGQKKTTTFAVW